MKWRNQFLALFCLIVFFAFGVFYFRYWVIQKPFGIILFIGEGLDAQTLAAARIYAGSADKPLTIDAFAYTALLKNYSADSATPDAAAAATAIATGIKVRNGSVAVDSQGHNLMNLLDLARDSGRMTGLITNGNVTAPTMASFYGHTVAPNQWEDLARQLVEADDIDLVLGGGSSDFLPQAQGGRRTDERDLLSAVREGGYDFVQTLEELEEVPRWRRAKLFGLFSESELAFGDELDILDDQPTLPDMVRRGIELLQFHRGGYLLVVDAALMRKAATQQQGQRMLAEALELDRAVSVALRYAGTKSAIFVCSDVAVGGEGVRGMSSHSAPASEHRDSPSSERKSVDAAQPTSESAAAPLQFQGATISRSDESPRPEIPPSGSVAPAHIALAPAEDVLAFGTGLGAEALRGTQESTAIFEIIRDNL